MNLKVDVFNGKEASVNSYIFSNKESAIVMDVLRNSKEAKELANFIITLQVPLTHILITHGHPDHYIGMDAIKKEFPDAAIVVANKGVKQDIINFSTWMESIGWLDNESNLKPKSEDNKEGFDYENNIDVLSSNTLTLVGGGTLEIKSDYNAAEAEHLTTVYSKDLNALFTSDFCYNGVHLWLGQGVDQQHISNWKQQLHTFKNQYTEADLTIYPGHGEKSDIQLFDIVLKYLSDFELTLKEDSSKEEAISKMKMLYPTWLEADFLLAYSVDYHISLKG